MSDFLDSGHGRQCCGYEVSIVSDRNVSSGGKGESGVDNELLTGGLSESLGPSQLTWVTSLFEGMVTFGTTETKFFGVVTHKHDSMKRIYGRRAEMALIDSHSVFLGLFGIFYKIRAAVVSEAMR